MKMLVLVVLIALFLFYAFAGYYASTLVIGEHPAWRKFAGLPADFTLAAEVVSFDSSDGTPLKAWWLRAQPTAIGNVVLAHGRDANRSRMLPHAALLVPHGYNVLALDLRNHGESGGKYITSGYTESRDILAAVSYVWQRGERTPIAVLGRSYGAVAALRAAADSPEIAAVISDSGFSSTETMMANTTRHLLLSKDTPLWAKGLLLLSRCPGLYTAAAVVIYARTGHYFGSDTTTVMPVLARLHKPVLFISGDTGSGRGEEPSGGDVLHLIQIRLATASLRKSCQLVNAKRCAREPPIQVPETQSAFHLHVTTNRLPSRCASAIQIVRHSESIVEAEC